MIEYRIDNIPENDRPIFCDMITYTSSHIYAFRRFSDKVEIEAESSSEEEVLAALHKLEEMILANLQDTMKWKSRFCTIIPISN